MDYALIGDRAPRSIAFKTMGRALAGANNENRVGKMWSERTAHWEVRGSSVV